MARDTRLIVIGDPSLALYTVTVSVVLLAVGFGMFALAYIGAGDAKLITAAALLVGYNDLPSFLLFMGICGAVMSFGAVVIHKFLPLYAGPRLVLLLPRARLAVPYGVAIAAGGIASLFLQSPLATFLVG